MWAAGAAAITAMIKSAMLAADHRARRGRRRGPSGDVEVGKGRRDGTGDGSTSGDGSTNDDGDSGDDNGGAGPRRGQVRGTSEWTEDDPKSGVWQPRNAEGEGPEEEEWSETSSSNSGGSDAGANTADKTWTAEHSRQMLEQGLRRREQAQWKRGATGPPKNVEAAEDRTERWVRIHGAARAR